jgi:hypothetical protein
MQGATQLKLVHSAEGIRNEIIRLPYIIQFVLNIHCYVQSSRKVKTMYQMNK